MENCTACSRTSDNKTFNCPPRMADGRHFTDYRPRCMGNFIMHDESLNSFEYRQYLIKNADNIMKQNSISAYKDNYCGPCVEPYDQGTMLPEQYMVACDQNTCKMTLNDQNGLGVGRQYTTNPTKEEQRYKAEFIRTKENEQAYNRQNVNCCGTQDSLNAFPYKPYSPEELQSMNHRTMIPSGAVAFEWAKQ